MTTENELIKTEEMNQMGQQTPHKQSWFSKIIERIQNLDAGFPLSGAENDHHPVIRSQPAPVRE